MSNIAKIFKVIFRFFGVEVSRLHEDGKLHGVQNESLQIIQAVRNFTMSSPERLCALVDAVKYLSDNNIEGDFVECGVWRGGSMMAAAMALDGFDKATREIYLFDTFDGMPPPGDHDKTTHGVKASTLLNESSIENKSAPDSIWCHASLEDVQANIKLTNYPFEKFKFIKGKVEDTLPDKAPEKIALLRLDTDWYESTAHEMGHLFPRLVRGGVLIIDDYGHWQGAKKAIDEYVKKNRVRLLLNRIDYTGRIAVKID